MTSESSFGKWIKARRGELGLTQRQLGSQVGCVAETIRKIEADRRRPSEQIAARLVECLGLDPAEQAVLLRRATDAPTAPAREAASAPAQQRLLETLPQPITPLIGREQELATTSAMLLRPVVRLLTLTGAPGIGKTRLALAGAAAVSGAFADGVTFVSLAALRDPLLVLPAIAQAVDVPQFGIRPLRERLHATLRQQQRLLLLDNFEQLLPAATDIAELLAAAPQVKVLVTSRALLRLTGEHELVVPPLALPDLSRPQPATDEQSCAAVALFVQRAQAARADFAVTPDNAPVIAQLCVRLDGLPLAIELAAARSKLFSPPALLARLISPLALLTGGARDLPDRQQTLRRTLDWSYELLAPDEQALFAQLAVFVGGWTMAAATAVCHGSSTAPLDVADSIAALLDQSLIRQETPHDAEPRFNLLEPIRAYAQERLAQYDEAPALRARHAAYYLSLADAATEGMTGAQQTVWLARLIQEQANFQAAFSWGLETGDGELLIRLSKGLNWFRRSQGQRSVGRSWAKQALAHSGGVPAELRAQALYNAGLWALIEDDFAEAQALLEQSLALWQTLGDRRQEVTTRIQLGTAARSQGDYTTAHMHYQVCQHLAHEQNGGTTLAEALNGLARIALCQGDLTQAEKYYREALHHFQSQSNQFSALFIEMRLATLAYYQQDYARARAAAETNLARARAVNNNGGMAIAHHLLGRVAMVLGEFATATTHVQASMAVWRDMGDWGSIVLLSETFVLLTARQGQFDAAMLFAANAATVRAVLGMPQPPIDRATYMQALSSVYQHYLTPLPARVLRWHSASAPR